MGKLGTFDIPYLPITYVNDVSQPYLTYFIVYSKLSYSVDNFILVGGFTHNVDSKTKCNNE